VNFTLSELAELPLSAALLDRDQSMVAHTPEWRGAGPGTVAYPVRSARLLVATGAAPATCHALLERLLGAIEAAAAGADPVVAMRLRMVSESLRVVSGRRAESAGRARDAIEHARTGITARTALAVSAGDVTDFAVQAPAAAALVMVQLAVNAERHAGATRVALSSERNVFHVAWPGDAGGLRVVTSRRRADRLRWGMGFARIAADTLGGAISGPYRRADGCVAASLEVGLGRLALPVAALRGRQVWRATRTWDEETGMPPGTEVTRGTRLAAARDAALRQPGRIAHQDGWCARTGRRLVWVAIPPDDVTDRARDVLAGLVHERALTGAVAEPARSRLTALGLLLHAALGQPLPRLPARAWNQRFLELREVYALGQPAPKFEGIAALDPAVVAMLAAESGAGFELDGDAMWLRIRPERRSDAAVSVLIEPGADRIRLA
jgi:hypothetical protein